jgi:uncharacterized protein with FMN-binding domain
MNRRNQVNGCLFVIRKFFLSAFVVISFIAYALEKKFSILVTGAEAPTLPAPTAVSSSVAPTGGILPTTAVVPTVSSGYKDGTYTGSSVYINWGYVQVQTTIQAGRISNVQVIQYPNERRTSIRINSSAVPELQQEAIQSQSANVNIITGATLTSEGFQQSLQSALDQAKSL